MISTEELNQLRRAAARSARAFRLPFRRELWRGSIGNWAGAGIGSSIDFQDHRPYVPGDDPRYIDWQAYARSDHYVMKLYREEVSPAVDVVLDASDSIAVDEVKLRGTLALFYFVVESALVSGAMLRPWLVTGSGPERLDVETVTRSADWLPRLGGEGHNRVDAASLRSVELRSGSLRVLVSDCLFPGEPEGIATALCARKGRAIVLAPSCRAESEPSWLGQLELQDCETGVRRVEHIDASRLDTYRAAYRRHFHMWGRSCRRRGIPFAHIPCELDLTEALRAHALGVSAVEPAA